MKNENQRWWRRKIGVAGGASFGVSGVRDTMTLGELAGALGVIAFLASLLFLALAFPQQ